ncbi:prenyltransferase [Riemerella anatipestifer]|uniref:geranylgeranylglycerol-phosphate geranylgeranyltransferase n=1 Tax=Riemerella anatipestifer TaxID=34085 RepID=UPI001AD690D5|nr:geranylgeranylglycerol-phosphate geranylgeranyltransferase [Riemerella anatipestifer]MBO4232737.1 prenyltransferase [Riemerella anatipestifer]
MQLSNSDFQKLRSKLERRRWFYRASQMVSLMLGVRVFVLAFYVFTLYVSTYFLFNQEESLRAFVFDYKVHGIIACSLLSIAAGGLINQFYDKEKDQITKPFRSYFQSFVKEKYILYSYLLLNVLSLGIALVFSYRILIFFLTYQFLIWFYSHKLSRIAVVNNLTYVSLSLYPFFGLLVYYQHFSDLLFLMSVFLFVLLLIIDVIKDIVTRAADKLFEYATIPVLFGKTKTVYLLYLLLITNSLTSYLIVNELKYFNLVAYYFSASILVYLLAGISLYFFRYSKMSRLINVLRVWIFIGVVFMLLNGVFERIV